MSYAEELKQKLQAGSTEIIRAVIYARVSTDNDGQKESCSNQVALARKYIADHPNITIVNIYVDDGISAKNDFERPQYQNMIKEIGKGEIDLVITKAQERINRNTTVSGLLKELLISTDTALLNLENLQVIDFEDPTAEFMYDIQAVVDAQFTRKQHLKGIKTHELRCVRKELSAKDCSFGYDWHKEDKTITINENQAEIVRRIYEDYVYRNATPASIHKALQNEGISICGRTVSNIIADERYIGKFYINKRTTKLGTGHTKSQRIQLPKEKWILCERPDLQIVDNDLFDMAQRIHRARITVYTKQDKKTTRARFRGTHKYASKIFCPICGKPYQFGYADRMKTLPIYRIKNHSACPNPIRSIYEHDLEEITKQALKQTIDQQNEVCTSLELLLTEIVANSGNNGAEIDRLKKQRTSREKQLDNLIEQLSEGGLTDASKIRIKDKINHITEETNRLTELIQDKETNKLDDSYISDKLTSIREAIKDLRNFTIIDRDRILNYIDCIEMPPNGDIEIYLMSGQIITIKQQDNSDFFDENCVGTTGKHLAPCS